MDVLLLVVGLIAGGSLVYILKPGSKKSVVTKEATLMLERLKEVSKLITVEGNYSEIIHYKEEKPKWMQLIPNNKKAILVIKAKALVGFDLHKAKFEIDSNSKSIKILHLPEAEVISIEPDIQYYDLKDSALNRFKPEDYSKMQQEAMALIKQKVLEGDLPEKAIQQGKQHLALLAEFAKWNGWKVETNYKLEK